jgi:hypothetical protein
MLSKCANPVCSNTFLYLRQGKLFRLEVPVGDQTVPDGSVNAKTSPNGRLRDEYFWLCETCCPNFKVVREQGVGLKVIPFNGAEPLGRDFQPGPREGRDVGTPNNRMKTDGSKSRIKGKLQMARKRRPSDGNESLQMRGHEEATMCGLRRRVGSRRELSAGGRTRFWAGPKIRGHSLEMYNLRQRLHGNETPTTA